MLRHSCVMPEALSRWVAAYKLLAADVQVAESQR